MSEEEPEQPPFRWTRSLPTGVAMGGADAVPGVSASTMALVLGAYERFIGALNDFISWPVRRRTDPEEANKAALDAVKFLIPIGFGMAIGLFLISRLLVGPDDTPGLLRRSDTGPFVLALLFGLVFATTIVPWRKIRSPEAVHYTLAAVACIGLATLNFLGVLTTTSSLWFLFISAMLAIAAMLIPGISGSLVLLILGQYVVISSALHDFEVGKLTVFALGAVAGGLVTVPIIYRLLKEHHDRTMAVLTGLILGSLPTLWPWKNNYDIEAGEITNVAPFGGVGAFIGILIFFTLGIGLLWSMQWIEGRLGTTTTEEE